MIYLAIDFEGSGTDPQEHAPVSLGVALMDDATVLESQEWLIQPPLHWSDPSKVMRCYDERARMIHGYTLEYLLENGIPIRDVCQDLKRFVTEHQCANRPNVAYNASYDLGMMGTLMFLGGEYDRAEREYRRFPCPISGPWQCVMQLAERRLPNLGRYRLDDVAECFGLSRTSDKHGALEDAIIAGRVFTAIREQQQAVAA